MRAHTLFRLVSTSCKICFKGLSIDSKGTKIIVFCENNAYFDFVLAYIVTPFSSPEPTILLACGRNQEALGATISGMRHWCRLRETRWAEFGYFLCYFKMVAPRALRRYVMYGDIYCTEVYIPYIYTSLTWEACLTWGAFFSFLRSLSYLSCLAYLRCLSLLDRSGLKEKIILKPLITT